jgi:hypothetical protein
VVGHRVEVTSKLVEGPGGADVIPAARERKNEITLSHQIDAPCRDCNSGWMNVLEKLVEPALVPLMRGTPCLLEPAAVKTLSEWVTLKFMVVDSANPPDSQIFTAHDREAFFKDRKIPACVEGIWAAPLAGGAWSAEWERVGGSNMASFSFGVGKVFFYAVCYRDLRLSFNDRRIRGGHLRRICPPQALQAWPPGPFLTDDEAERINLSLLAFLRQNDIKIEATIVSKKLRVTKAELPKLNLQIKLSQDPATGQWTTMVGNEFVNHKCGGCDFTLLHRLSIETFAGSLSPSRGPVFLVCPKCDAKNVVPVKLSK